MADILFHPQAEAEYDEAIAWYRARSAQAATRFEVEMDRVLRLIGDNPGMFPQYDDEHRFAVLQRFPYSIVYQVQPGEAYVVAIAHSSRSSGYWQGRG